jgi:nucleotide-binding universal stress UspA family protein
MLGIHTILCPTDFSESSDFAFRLACSLASDYGARIIVLHVVAPLEDSAEESAVAHREGHLTAAQTQLREVRPPDPMIHVLYRLVGGEPVAEILHAAEEARADLIVMGTHGRLRLARLLQGSVAEQVMREARCPVLTTRDPAPETVISGQRLETAFTSV